MVRANSARKSCSLTKHKATRQSCAVHGVRVAAVQLLSGLQEAQCKGHPRSPWTTMDCAWLRSSMSRPCGPGEVQVTKAQKAQSTHSECSPPILDAVHPFAAELTFLSLADHLARVCSSKGFSCSPPAQARYRLLQARYRVDCSENHGLHNFAELPSCRVQF